jgi:hypothetical protein
MWSHKSTLPAPYKDHHKEVIKERGVALGRPGRAGRLLEVLLDAGPHLR